MTDRQSLAALGRDWTTLGEEDPLWAVYVDPAKRGGRWDVGEFMATGQREIQDAVADLDRLKLCARRDSALDFGCGVGRLTAALSEHFDAVTGVDISAPMLSHAERLHAGNERCTFVRNDSADLSAFADGSFDLVYSSIVLQHMPRELSDGYLREFVRLVRPGGAIAIVVPQRHLRTPRGLIYAYAPRALVAWLQKTAFDFPAPMRMHLVPAAHVRDVVEPLGARVRETVPRPWPGHWEMATIYISLDGDQER